jgi:endonuclease/exonuclease/phosphatase family metal-dependent hydrolase
VSKLPVKKWIRKDLGKAPLGAPLLIGMRAGQRLIVAPDELRTAIAAILHNGWIVINTHLSFVPGFNIRQIRTLVRWANELEHEFDSRVVIAGDFNLPGRLVRTVTRWHSPEKGATFPQWNPKIEFDHFLLNPDMRHHAQVNARVEVPQIYGDHLPITLDSE